LSSGLPSTPSTAAGGPPEAPQSAAAQRAARRRERAGDAEAGEAGKAGRWAASPEIAWREPVLAFLGGLLLAIITSWPLVLHMPSRIAPDLGDPVRTAWEVAFVGHQMLHNRCTCSSPTPSTPIR